MRHLGHCQLPAALLTTITHLDAAAGEEVAEAVGVLEAALRPEIAAQGEDRPTKGATRSRSSPEKVSFDHSSRRLSTASTAATIPATFLESRARSN